MYSKNKSLYILFFFLAFLFGSGFALLSEYAFDLEANPDILSYLNLAENGMDDSPVRRYRVIIPFLAAMVDTILGPLFEMLKPWSFPGPDFSLCMSFFMVNWLIMALAFSLCYELCRHRNCTLLASLMACLALVTCRWTAYLTALPLVDSLYLLSVVVLIFSIEKKSFSLFVFALILGPWAKESYIFFVPLILIYSPFGLKKNSLTLLVSGILVFAFRYLWDRYLGFPPDEGLVKDFDHINRVGAGIKRLSSFHGIYELFSILGLWNILLAVPIFIKQKSDNPKKIPSYAILFLSIILIHALLSNELARMFYLAAPILILILAVNLDRLNVASFFKVD